MSEEISWATMVLLPKGKGEYQGIGIVKVLWRVCSLVLNCCLKSSIVFHNALNGFREGWVMGTATLEDNIAQQLSGLAHKPLFQVVLNVRKAYDSLDRERYL